MLVDCEIKPFQTILLPPSYYQSEVFEYEKTALFDRTWQFACFYRNLKNNNDYFTMDYFGKSVVIKNFDGELKAFLNVCSHRFSRICQKKTGNGFLQCPYHGWTYDKEGYPAIRSRNEFPSLNIEDLKLIAFDVERCGEFVFIRKYNSELDLSEFLGSNYQFLLSVSDGLGELVDENNLEINANWKIVVENTLEEYHVSKVHPNSIAQMGLSDPHYYFNERGHSCTKMSVKNQLEDNSKLSKIFNDRKFKVEGYHHYLMFPNMTLATTFGTTFSIQKITPISSRKTHFVSYVFGVNLNREKSAIKNAYEQTVKDLNQRVFYEDKLICEEVQRGIEMTEKNISPLSKQEQRIFYFQKACSEYVKYEK